MALELTFHGAAGTVTGSCMELDADGRRLLVDFGLFQGSRALEDLNHQALPFDPMAIDAVVLTHAHLDHSGRLPQLARAGSRATIWCTPPTRQLLEPLLLDAAQIQASDARRRNRRPDRAGMPPFEPLYTPYDVKRMLRQVQDLDWGDWAEPVPGVKMRFWDAHHILGSASVELRVGGQRLLFSGDIGAGAARADRERRGFDHVVCEATYGDRDRRVLTADERREILAGFVGKALARGGNLLIPAFALERTQVVLEDLAALFADGRLQPSPIYVDSPLADRVTHAYRRFAPKGGSASPFNSPHLRFTTGEAQSRALNRLSGVIIIAGSGMCNGGRIRHHLIRNLPREDSTVLFVGYQARGTLGAVLRSGARAVRISGNDVHVRATIEATDIYSAHADRSALLEWLGNCAPVQGGVFLDHGEEPALERLAADAAGLGGLAHRIVPRLGERFLLEAGKAPRRTGKPYARADELVAAEDWRSRYAAFAATLEERLRALPNDTARRRALEAADRALARKAG